MDLTEYKKCFDELDQHKIFKLKEYIDYHNHIIILGNGGSNAISCHIAEDYTKVFRKRAICFGDSARLSCYANDYGWDNAYTKFIEHFSEVDSLVILISSSGKSLNIINSASYCFENAIPFIILSGFDKDNPLKKLFGEKSEIDLHIDSRDYGVVECLHELFLHSIL